MTTRFVLPPDEIQITAIRAQGAGGQHVNKVSTAVHLRFDIPSSSLPAAVRERLLNAKDHRIGKDGVLVIKAQAFRSLEQNRRDALRRLDELLAGAMEAPKDRRPTRPTRGSVRRRLDEKSRRSALKAGRRAGSE